MGDSHVKWVFPVAGNKDEKKNCVEIEMGYCPIVLKKEMKLYCDTVMVLQRIRLVGNCIARPGFVS